VYIILCFEGDLSALWACQGLREAGLAPIELVTAGALAFAKSWEHRIGSEGIRLKVEVADGRVFCSSQIKGVLNRLASAPEGFVQRAALEDREYASGESSAFYLSWLGGLPGVINRPTPHGLPGTWRHISEWALLADQAGFTTPPYRQSSASRPEEGYLSLAPPGAVVNTVIVFRGELYGAAVPSAVGEACRKLAEVAGTELLGVDLFLAGDGALMFAHATPLPNLTLGGTDLIAALARAFQTAPR